MSGVDLHTHTTASDGTYAPDELVREAVRRGVRILESIQERPWGHRDFLLADPDGNVVWITQVLARQTHE